MAETTKSREVYWRNWQRYVMPLGMDPYLQDTKYRRKIRALSGFAARVRSGYYGRRKQVQAGTVSQALSAVGTTISLAVGCNPIKEKYSTKLAPRLRQMLDGWSKEDPPTMKKLPVEVDIPEFLAKQVLPRGH